MSQPKAVLRLFNATAPPPHSIESRPPLNGLLLAAHPDDETIGASAVLNRLSGWNVVYLTDGAPFDPELRSPDFRGSRDEYAAVRAKEAVTALALVSIPNKNVHFLNGVDQQSVNFIFPLASQFLALLRELRPEIVLTHAYEGGHPDHDSAALIARICVERLHREIGHAPSLLEMTSYHAAGDRCVTGEFLDSSQAIKNAASRLPVASVQFTKQELARKQAMMDCHASQRRVLAHFPLQPERIRVAPDYWFERPPHRGPLWYERLGWPLTGKLWRHCAAAALADEGVLQC